MKFILWTMLALLALQINYANAHGSKVDLVPFQQAHGQTKTMAFETYAGQFIKLNQIKDMGTAQTRPLNTIIKDGLIELRSGDIFYSEELKFVVTPRGEFTGASRALHIHSPLGRAPHTPK